MSIEFLTLTELADRAGFPAAADAMFFAELANDDHSLLQPYVMVAGLPMAVSRSALADNYHENQDAVRVKSSDVDKYLDVMARVRAAEPLDNAGPNAGSFPRTFDGRPDFAKFRTAEHVMVWLTTGGDFQTEDFDAEINAHIMRLMDLESENPDDH